MSSPTTAVAMPTHDTAGSAHEAQHHSTVQRVSQLTDVLHTFAIHTAIHCLQQPLQQQVGPPIAAIRPYLRTNPTITDSQQLGAALPTTPSTPTTYIPPAQRRTLFPHQLNPPHIPNMRPVFAPLLLAPLAALANPNLIAPFELALPISSNNSTDPDLLDPDLLKRQNNNACATNYYACAALDAPGLCCPRTAICTADSNRAVACCPQGAQCTGTLGLPPASSASLPSSAPATTTTAPPFQASSIPNAGSPPLSTVPNAFYPFPAIPTTYTDAAACSAAFSSCSYDAAKCTTALANGAMGVTVSAPNGGATITAVPSVGLQSAQSICNSLSSLGCSGLQVEACRSFGGEGSAATMRCGGGYLMGAGVVVGLAGQMLQ